VALTYDDLDVAVRKIYLPDIINQVFKATPFLVRLLAQDNIVVQGGRKIAQPVVYGKLPGGSYWGFDSFDISYAQTHTYAEWNWKAVYVNVTIPGTDLALADSPEQIIGLLDPKMEAANLTMRDKLATMIYGDGTGNAGKDLDGLQNGIDDGTSYSNYAGIDRSTETWWKAQYKDAGGADLTLGLMQEMYGKCTDGDIQPDLILMRQTLYDKVWNLVQPQQRFLSESFAELKEVGFEGFMFNRAAVVVDNYVNPSDAVYFINTRYVQLVINQNKNFDWTPPKTPVQQDAYVRQLLTMCNLCVLAPWRCGKLVNVT